MRSTRWRSIVSSELQLLGLIEARAAGLLDDGPLTVSIAGPYWPEPALVGLLTNHGLTVERLDASAVARFVFGRHLVAGDLYGRLLTARLALGSVRKLVIVQDGLGTMVSMRQVAERRRLVRPRGGPGTPLDRVEPLARRTVRRLAARGGLTWVVTRSSAEHLRALDTPSVGELVEHAFEHLPPEPTDDHLVGIERLVLGAAMRVDGVVRHEFYDRWLDARLAEHPERTLFWPHRREDEVSSARARRHGVRVGTGSRCVERLVRSLPALSEVHLLPSSPAVTLPGLVPPGTTITVWPLDPDHLTTGAGNFTEVLDLPVHATETGATP